MTEITLDSEEGFGIVLSGGGTGGAYEAGVIKALNEAGVTFKACGRNFCGGIKCIFNSSRED